MDTPASAYQFELDEGGYIDQDAACIGCSYNLRGLRPDSVCPECGTPIGRSVYGDLLQYSDPGWVSTLASGANWIVAGILIAFLGSILGAVVMGATLGMSGRQITWFGLFTSFLGLVTLIGIWKVTAPDPSKDETGINVRNTARIVYAIKYVLGITQQGLAMTFSITGQFLVIPAALLGLVWIWSIFTWGERLASRIPEPSMARQITIVKWGMIITTILGFIVGILMIMQLFSGTMPGMTPATATGPAGPTTSAMIGLSLIGVIGCVTGLGSLVFTIWSLILLLRFRSLVNQCAEYARQTWAAESGAGETA